MNTRAVPVGILILGILILWLAFGRSACPPLQPKHEVVYRIPPAKQDAAAQMTVQLILALSHSGYSPAHIANTAREQVLAVYGEPVTEAPKP